MENKGTQGTQIIEHDWEKIKLPTNKYTVSKMRINIFRYRIVEELEDEKRQNNNEISKGGE